MKTNMMFTAAVLATALFATGAAAQTAAPTVSQTPPTAAISLASPMPAPNSIIYIPRLPTPAEISNAAAAQGLAIAKMEQTSDHVTVVYQYANGQTNTVSYQLLSAAGIATTAPATTTTVVPTATTATVIYPQPSYYYYDPFYYPWGWPWYAPVSLSLGFGYGYGHFGGGHFGGGHFGGGHFGGGPGFRHR